jgi:hypothetical protein
MFRQPLLRLAFSFVLIIGLVGMIAWESAKASPVWYSEPVSRHMACSGFESYVSPAVNFSMSRDKLTRTDSIV